MFEMDFLKQKSPFTCKFRPRCLTCMQAYTIYGVRPHMANRVCLALFLYWNLLLYWEIDAFEIFRYKNELWASPLGLLYSLDLRVGCAKSGGLVLLGKLRKDSLIERAKKKPVLCCVMGDVLSPCPSPSQIAFFGPLLLMTLLASSLFHAPTFPIILLMHPSTIAYSISCKNAPPP